MMDFVQLQLLTVQQIKEGMTFIDDSVSFSLSPCIICDSVNDLIRGKRTWLHPEDFTYNTASCFKNSLTMQLLTSAKRSIPSILRFSNFHDNGEMFYEGNAMISNGSIVPLLSTNETYPDMICEVRLSRNIIQSQSDEIKHNHQFFLAKELSSMHNHCSPHKSSHLAISLTGKQKYTNISVPNTYMLNVLPSALLPPPSTLDATEVATMKLLDVHELILKGDKGSGKTYYSLLIAAKLRMRHHFMTSYIDCHQLQSSILRMDEILQELTNVFKQAAISTPSLIILDNIDSILPDIESNVKDEGQKQRINPDFGSQVQLLKDHVHFLTKGVRQSNQKHHFGVAMLMTCRQSNAIRESIGSINLAEFEVPKLVGSESIGIFKQMLCEKLGNDAISFISVANIAEALYNYNPLDMTAAAANIASNFRQVSNSTNNTGIVLQDCIDKVLSTYIPISHQSLNLTKYEPAIGWGDIGGLFEAKSDLSEAILQPIKYKLIYDNLPIRIPKGILLFGPPGCGKTSIVPALAKECNYNLITCRGPELFDKYIGASEAKVRKLFEKAYAAAPSILFLDDFDSLAPRRGSDNTGVTDRVVNQLLTFLDGVEVHNDEDVYIIAASSRPDKIDPALLRPGRLELHVFIGFSATGNEWSNLFTKIALKYDLKEDLKLSILDKTFFEGIFQQGDSYLLFSAADIKGIFDTAHLNAVHELIESNQAKLSHQWFIDKKHLLSAFSLSRPSLPHSDRIALAQAYLPFIGKDVCEHGCYRALGLDSSRDYVSDNLKDKGLHVTLK